MYEKSFSLKIFKRDENDPINILCFRFEISISRCE